MEDKIYQLIAGKLTAMASCKASQNDEWFDRHQASLELIVTNHLPSGSGFDNGTRIDLDKSTSQRLVFNTSFHHMTDQGSYDGWTDHSVIVTPNLVYGFDLKITGRNRRDIKDYIGEVFRDALEHIISVQA